MSTARDHDTSGTPGHRALQRAGGPATPALPLYPCALACAPCVTGMPPETVRDRGAGRCAVHGPASPGWLLVALCAATGAYCLLRMRSAVEEQRRAAGG